MTNESFGRLARFLVVGGLNTALTYGIYVGLTWHFPPWMAYGTAYALGIAIAFVGNRSWVFRSTRSWASVFPYAMLQVSLLGFGSAVSWMLTGLLPAWAIGLVAITVNLPLSFLANTFFFRSRSTPEGSP